MKCDCKDWKENIDKVNAPFLFQQARNPHLKGYDGRGFIYCPWCSALLKEGNTEIRNEVVAKPLIP